LNDLEAWLKEICCTSSGPYLRPFAPNPKWRQAEVVVIGTNPATPLRKQFPSFEAYWRTLTQNPKEFNEIYSREHVSGESTTTKRLHILTDNLTSNPNKINVLITNAVWLPSGSASKITCPEISYGHECLKRLLDGIKPRVIFAHGKPALGKFKDCKRVEGIQHNFPNVPDYLIPPEEQGKSQANPLILTYPHLTGAGLPKGTKFNYEDDLKEFAKVIRKRLGKPKPSQPKRKRKAKTKRSRALSPEQIEMHRALNSLRQKIRAGRGTSKAKPSKKSKAKP